MLRKCAVAFAASAPSGSKYKVYKAGINVWWVNMLSLAVAVPLLNSAIQKLQAHYFKKPSCIPLDVVAAVDDEESAALCIHNRNLQIVSPPEILFAFVAAVYNDLNKGDDDNLAEWKEAMLNCPCSFTKVSNKGEVHTLCVQFREDLAENYATMRFNAIQKMFDVKAVAAQIEATTGSATTDGERRCPLQDDPLRWWWLSPLPGHRLGLLVAERRRQLSLRPEEAPWRLSPGCSGRDPARAGKKQGGEDEEDEEEEDEEDDDVED